MSATRVPRVTAVRAEARVTAIAKLDARARRPRAELTAGEPVVIGFDGSRSDDHVIVYRRADGRMFLLDTRPPLHTFAHAVDRAVRENA